MYQNKIVKLAVLAVSLVFISQPVSVFASGSEGEHEDHSNTKVESAAKKMVAHDGPMTLTGEIVDLMCYLSHGATGQDHADCAKKCIAGGGPVGLLTKEHGLFLVVGSHKPINDKLAPLAAKNVTLKGKVVQKDGVKLLSSAVVVD